MRLLPRLHHCDLPGAQCRTDHVFLVEAQRAVTLFAARAGGVVVGTGSGHLFHLKAIPDYLDFIDGVFQFRVAHRFSIFRSGEEIF